MNWQIFTGADNPHDKIDDLPAPPPWRRFDGKVVVERSLPAGKGAGRPIDVRRGRTFKANPQVVETVNAALYLRRPILVTGKPGSGKSSLTYAVAYELKLGEVLQWPITSKSTLQKALYDYDAIGRLQATQFGNKTPEIEDYLKLGPLGTALLPTRRPRALLIDEIDKSDIDLPNDLLNIFEEGWFEIPELARLEKPTVNIRDHSSRESYPITKGYVQCREFPFVVLTSNGERDFPPAFLRRCLRLEMPEPDPVMLENIVASHLGRRAAAEAKSLIKDFFDRKTAGSLATDQLLNAIYLLQQNREGISESRDALVNLLLKELTTFASS